VATREELVLAVTAQTSEAKKALADLQRLASELDDESISIVVDAVTAPAEEQIRRAEGLVERLNTLDPTIDIAVKSTGIDDVDHAVTQVERLGTTSEETGARVTRGMGNAGNAVANLAGPFGQAQGAASNFAGVFDGLNDLLASFGAQAGLTEATMAGLSTAIGGIGIVVAAGAAAWAIWQQRGKAAAETAKEVAKETKDMTDALLEAKTAGEDAAGALSDVAKSKVVDTLEGMGSHAPKVVKALNTLGINANDLIGSFDGTNTKLQDSVSLLDEYEAALTASVYSTHPVTAAVNLLAVAHGKSAEEMQSELDAVRTVNDGLSDQQKEALAAAKAAKSLTGYLGDATAANHDFTDAIDKTAGGFDAIANRMDAYGKALDRLNGGSALTFSEMAAHTVDTFDELKAAIKKTQDLGSRPLVPTGEESLRGLTDEQAKVIDSLGGMRDAIQNELQYALQHAGGDFQAVIDKASFFRAQVADQFPAYFQGLGLSADSAKLKTAEVTNALGLMPKDIEVLIKVSKDEEAKEKLKIFADALGKLPPEVEAKVMAAVDAGQPQEAWKLVEAEVKRQGDITTNLDVNTAHAEGEVISFVDRASGHTITIPVKIIPTILNPLRFFPGQNASVGTTAVPFPPPAPGTRSAPVPVQAAQPAPVTNVYVSLPPGADSDSRVVGAIQRWTSRNGRIPTRAGSV